MGKKNKGDAPNPNNIANRDILQRLNFLYQASAYLESISRQSVISVNEGADPSGSPSGPPAGSTDAEKAEPSTTWQSKAQKRKHDRGQRKGRVVRASDIGEGYVRAMRLISQKTTVKMWVFFRSTGMRVLPDA
jgi:ribonuclease P protein subunit RPR2